MARMRARVEVNEKGIRQLLGSRDAAKITRDAGEQLARNAEIRAGKKAEFDARTFQGKDRARTHVGTANPAAMEAEAKNRVLTREAYRMRGRG